MKKLQVIFVILFAIIGIMVISTSSFAMSEEEIVVEREDVKHTHTTEQVPPQQHLQQQEEEKKKLADLQVPQAQPPLSRFGDEFDDFFNMKEDVADLITLAATGRLPQSPQRPMNLFSRIVDRYHNTIDKLMNKLRTTTHYDLDLPHWLPHTPSTPTSTAADKNAMAPSSSSIASWFSRDFTPHVDVSETDTQIRIHADLPGLKKEDIHVEIRPALGNREKLIIHGERRSSNIVTIPTTEETAATTTTTDQEKKQQQPTTTTTPNIKYRSVERSFGSFTREFLLPMGTQRKGIAAKYENGVLDVTVEKPTQLPAAEKPFSIDIM